MYSGLRKKDVDRPGAFTGEQYHSVHGSSRLSRRSSFLCLLYRLRRQKVTSNAFDLILLHVVVIHVVNVYPGSLFN